jgi:hypothetical protein
MTFWQMLLRIELCALVALLICAGLVALYSMVDTVRASLGGETALLTPFEAGWSGFGYTLAIGALPVILYGAPIYAILRFKDLASWLPIVLVGIAPGVVMFLLGARDLKSDLTIWFLIGGVVVACLTHLLSSYGKLQLPG